MTSKRCRNVSAAEGCEIRTDKLHCDGQCEGEEVQATKRLHLCPIPVDLGTASCVARDEGGASNSNVIPRELSENDRCGGVLCLGTKRGIARPLHTSYTQLSLVENSDNNLQSSL